MRYNRGHELGYRLQNLIGRLVDRECKSASFLPLVLEQSPNQSHLTPFGEEYETHYLCPERVSLNKVTSRNETHTK